MTQKQKVSKSNKTATISTPATDLFLKVVLVSEQWPETMKDPSVWDFDYFKKQFFPLVAAEINISAKRLGLMTFEELRHEKQKREKRLSKHIDDDDDDSSSTGTTEANETDSFGRPVSSSTSWGMLGAWST